MFLSLYSNSAKVLKHQLSDLEILFAQLSFELKLILLLLIFLNLKTHFLVKVKFSVEKDGLKAVAGKERLELSETESLIVPKEQAMLGIVSHKSILYLLVKFVKLSRHSKHGLLSIWGQLDHCFHSCYLIVRLLVPLLHLSDCLLSALDTLQRKELVQHIVNHQCFYRALSLHLE